MTHRQTVESFANQFAFWRDSDHAGTHLHCNLMPKKPEN